MVKSKKMSKSTVAIVLLSLLLVLSLILTATGAWFTYTASKDAANTDGSYTFRNNAMSVTFGDVSSDFGKVYRGDNEVTNHDDIMPGDVIKGGSVEATIVLADGNTAYAIYKVGNGAWKNVKGDTEVNSGDDLAAASNGDKITVSCKDITLTGENYNNDYQGQEIAVTEISLGAITIRMIQTENITTTDAYSLLTAGSFQANKA